MTSSVRVRGLFPGTWFDVQRPGPPPRVGEALDLPPGHYEATVVCVSTGTTPRKLKTPGERYAAMKDAKRSRKDELRNRARTEQGRRR